MATGVAKTKMTAAHKAALAKGRAESRVVRDYLDALEAVRPKRGRKRTPASISKRLADVQKDLATTTNSLRRLNLIQEQNDLEAELGAETDEVDVAGLEKDFVKVARAYGERKGITYPSWRSIGVSAKVLQQAGVARTRG